MGCGMGGWAVNVLTRRSVMGPFLFFAKDEDDEEKEARCGVVEAALLSCDREDGRSRAVGRVHVVAVARRGIWKTLASA